MPLRRLPAPWLSPQQVLDFSRGDSASADNNRGPALQHEIDDVPHLRSIYHTTKSGLFELSRAQRDPFRRVTSVFVATLGEENCDLSAATR